MSLSIVLGLLALVGIALALTVRRTRMIGSAVFVISLVVLIAGAHPWG